MPNFRRARIPGGTYFFTVTIANRRSDVLVAHIDRLREAVAETRRSYPFQVDAWVVLPDHLHCLWTLPPGDHDFSLRWQLIKTRFTRAVGGPSRWQRRFWEHLVRDERDFQAHVDYVHWNPVKHGWASRALDWPYSTFRRYVEQGSYPPNWGAGTEAPPRIRMGERE